MTVGTCRRQLAGIGVSLKETTTPLVGVQAKQAQKVIQSNSRPRKRRRGGYNMEVHLIVLRGMCRGWYLTIIARAAGVTWRTICYLRMV